MRQEKQKLTESARDSAEQNDKEKLEEKGEVQLRAITLGDFVKAKDEVSPSVSEDALAIAEVPNSILYPTFSLLSCSHPPSSSVSRSLSFYFTNSFFFFFQLRKWNDMYGEGGSRVKSTLTYFM